MGGPTNIILLGDPGAGKGEQCKRIRERRMMAMVDMGEELRSRRNRLRDVLQRTMDQGKLTPTAIVQRILSRAILGAPPDCGILFNGTPKMLVEARLVARLLERCGRGRTLLLYLAVPAREIAKRARGRKRRDDTRGALKNRAAYYRAEVLPALRFLKSRYVYQRVDGVGSIEEVRVRIEEAIAGFEKNGRPYAGRP